MEEKYSSLIVNMPASSDICKPYSFYLSSTKKKVKKWGKRIIMTLTVSTIPTNVKINKQQNLTYTKTINPCRCHANQLTNHHPYSQFLQCPCCVHIVIQKLFNIQINNQHNITTFFQQGLILLYNIKTKTSIMKKTKNSFKICDLAYNMHKKFKFTAASQMEYSKALGNPMEKEMYKIIFFIILYSI